MQLNRKSPGRWLLLVLLSSAVGCSEEVATVSGIVLMDGNPLAISEGVRGTVVFQPANRQGPTLNGVIGPKGFYELTSGSSKTAAPGIYMATVFAVEIVASPEDSAMPTGRRITPKKYAKASESGLRYKVTPGSNSLAIELHSEVEKEDVQEFGDDQGETVGLDPTETEVSVANSNDQTE